jgi:hypothetical protein
MNISRIHRERGFAIGCCQKKLVGCCFGCGSEVFPFFCGGRLDFRIAMEEEKAGIKSMRQNLIEVRDFLILRVSM